MVFGISIGFGNVLKLVINVVDKSTEGIEVGDVGGIGTGVVGLLFFSIVLFGIVRNMEANAMKIVISSPYKNAIIFL